MKPLHRWILIISLILSLSFMSIGVLLSPAKAQGSMRTIRVSVASDGTEGNQGSSSPSISGDERFVAFQSEATNLVEQDTNNFSDIFLFDRQTAITTLISIATDGTQGNADSFFPLSNSDGRYIVFWSGANNLVPEEHPTNVEMDVFVRDTGLAVTERVSTAYDGGDANNISYPGTISDDGRYVVFTSFADNLVLNDTNGTADIFVRDLLNHTTTLVSRSNTGEQGNGPSLNPDISADGRYIVFDSTADNLIPNDINATSDVFIYDSLSDGILLVSLGFNAQQSNGYSFAAEVNGNGRYITFESEASNLVIDDTNTTDDIFVRDTFNNVTQRISVSSSGIQGNQNASSPAISNNGRYVVFSSRADNLVPGDVNNFCDTDDDGDFNDNCSDVFVHDRVTGETTIMSVSNEAIQGNSSSGGASISRDGGLIGFSSTASNLVSNDTNVYCDNDEDGTLDDNCRDVFIREWKLRDKEIFIPLSVRNYAFPVLPCGTQDVEPNNRFSEAVAHPALCPDTQLTGTANRKTDLVDFFRLEVEQSVTLQIDLTDLPPTSDFDLYLYNEVGVQQSVGNQSGSQNEQIRVSVMPGRYFIGVVPIVDDPVSTTYTLRWLAQ